MDPIATAWETDRRYLLAVAARILADPVEAEDVVQDAFARLALQPGGRAVRAEHENLHA